MKFILTMAVLIPTFFFLDLNAVSEGTDFDCGPNHKIVKGDIESVPLIVDGKKKGYVWVTICDVPQGDAICCIPLNLE
jgi:hypothetical protein